MLEQKLKGQLRKSLPGFHMFNCVHGKLQKALIWMKKTTCRVVASITKFETSNRSIAFITFAARIQSIVAARHSYPEASQAAISVSTRKYTAVISGWLSADVLCSSEKGPILWSSSHQLNLSRALTNFVRVATLPWSLSSLLEPPLSKAWSSRLLGRRLLSLSFPARQRQRVVVTNYGRDLISVLVRSVVHALSKAGGMQIDIVFKQCVTSALRPESCISWSEFQLQQQARSAWGLRALRWTCCKIVGLPNKTEYSVFLRCNFWAL